MSRQSSSPTKLHPGVFNWWGEYGDDVLLLPRSPERKLFLAVIIRAILDAGSRNAFHRDHALAWLESDRTDEGSFFFFAEYTALDAETFMSRIRQFVQSGACAKYWSENRLRKDRRGT